MLVTENTNQADALIDELLSMNRTENVFEALTPSAPEAEQRQAKRKKIRQELVAALSVRCR